MENKIDLTGNSSKGGSTPNLAESLNLGLLIYILNKSILWIILIISVCVFSTFIYLRYAPRIYESSAKMMLQVQKSTQILGIENLVFEKDQSEINREMQVLKSNLMLEQVANRLPLSIGYFKEGKSKFISDDLYTNAPFEIKLVKIAPEFYGEPIYIRLVNKQQYILSYSYEGEQFERKFAPNEKIETSFFSAIISFKLDKIGDNDFGSVFYVKFNDKQTLIADLYDKITIEPITASNRTLIVTCSDRNPERAKDIANALSDEFMQYHLQKKREGISNVITFIDSQIDSFGKSQEAIQDSVSNFKLSNEFFSDAGSFEDILKQVDNLQQNILQAENKLAVIENFKMLLQKTKDYTTLPILKFSDSEISLESEISAINTLQKDRETKLLERTEDHPEIRLIDKQIAAAKNQLLKRTDNVIDNAQLSLAKQRETYQKAMDKLYLMPELQEKLKRLNRIADARNKFFYNLFDQRSSYAIASAGIVSDYSMLSVASTPKVPVSPKETEFKIGGLIIGILLSLLLIVARYLLHNTISSTQEIESRSKVPLLGVVPSYNTPMERSQIVVTRNPKSTITEAFRAIRSNLQFINNSNGSKILTTTSTIPGEGKTFMALNLAAIFSMLNKKVIIIDLDMRKPRLGKIFGIPQSKGMSTILSKQSSYDECIIASDTPNLDIITSGPIPPNPSELILTDELDKFLDYLKTKYDIIVLDTPPIGLVTDAIDLMKRADYPIYVIRAAYSNKSFVESINKLYSESAILNLGIVLNDYGRGASGYGYGGSYGYGYGYGYGYSYGYGAYGSYGVKTGYYTDDTSNTQEKKSFLSKILNALKP